MKRLSTMAAVLLLGGCAAQGTSPPALSTTDLQGKITNAIQVACTYQVTADTALSLAGLAASPFIAGSPALASFLESVASGVCKSVAPTASASAVRPGAPRAAVPTYGGVVIHGRFVGS